MGGWAGMSEVGVAYTFCLFVKVNATGCSGGVRRSSSSKSSIAATRVDVGSSIDRLRWGMERLSVYRSFGR